MSRTKLKQALQMILPSTRLLKTLLIPRLHEDTRCMHEAQCTVYTVIKPAPRVRDVCSKFALS